ncbi:hypothetical protein VTN77DRAFT_3861 [Rasamsonia byssochlamydoides]|uniref:uncharacterized protein n=1 Tax=Rasamsonia byssochlamydoides TaxID=89139 RepID=UPI0037423E10
MPTDITKQLLSSGAEVAISGLKSGTSWALNQAKKHPLFTANAVFTVATLPYGGPVKFALGAVGFGPLGPMAGSLAAWYQSTYLGGCIPSDSLFSFCQYLSMA